MKHANSFAKWVNDNELMLNLKKTVAIIFGSKPYIDRVNLDICTPIEVNGYSIKYVNVVQNLGVWMDSILTWKNHIERISNRINSSLFMLKMHRKSLSHSIRRKLVQSFIIPLFDYSCTV